MDLALTFATIGPCAVLHCDGRIVSGPQADCLVRRCSQIFESYPALGLQLSGVTTLDSGGAGTLVRILNTARKQGKELTIISPSEKVMRVLESTNLNSVFTIYTSVEEFFTPPLKRAAATA